MSVPGCSCVGATTLVTRGTGVDDEVSFVVRRFCNVDNMGSSMSVPGCSCAGATRVVTRGAGVDDDVSFVVRRFCNLDNIGYNIS